jgi:hypothetical protein
MFRLLTWFRRSSQARGAFSGHHHSFRPVVEQFGEGSSTARTERRRSHSFRPETELLEERRLLTSSGTISAVVDGWGDRVEYGIDNNGYTWRNYGNWEPLGCPCSQLSAGLDANGRAQVFGIGPDSNVWVRNWIGWRQISSGNPGEPVGPIRQVNGTVRNEAYVLDQNNGVWLWNGVYWEDPLGGPVSQVSAGISAFGRDQVFAIGSADGMCYVNAGFGWRRLDGAGPFTQISATTHNAVYAIDTNGAAWAYDPALGWQGLGGSFLQISAALDAYGRDEFFAVGADDEAWVHDNYGWHELLVNNTSGAYDSLTRNTRGPSVRTYVTDISGMSGNAVFAVDETHVGWEHTPSGWSTWADAPIFLGGGGTSGGGGSGMGGGGGGLFDSSLIDSVSAWPAVRAEMVFTRVGDPMRWEPDSVPPLNLDSFVKMGNRTSRSEVFALAWSSLAEEPGNRGGYDLSIEWGEVAP